VLVIFKNRVSKNKRVIQLMIVKYRMSKNSRNSDLKYRRTSVIQLVILKYRVP